MPTIAPERYAEWAGINEISRASDWSGVLEKRRGALMAHDENELRERMARYCDARISFEELRRTGIGPVLDAGRFNAERARGALLGIVTLDVVRERRWCGALPAGWAGVIKRPRRAA